MADLQPTAIFETLDSTKIAYLVFASSSIDLDDLESPALPRVTLKDIEVDFKDMLKDLHLTKITSSKDRFYFCGVSEDEKILNGLLEAGDSDCLAISTSATKLWKKWKPSDYEGIVNVFCGQVFLGDNPGELEELDFDDLAYDNRPKVHGFADLSDAGAEMLTVIRLDGFSMTGLIKQWSYGKLVYESDEPFEILEDAFSQLDQEIN